MRVHQKHADPAFQVGSQHQVEILRQRVVRPAPRFLDGGAAPDAAGAVELERHAAAGTDVLLHGEVRVLHEALGARQPVAFAIAPFDARLHEGRSRMGEHRGHRLLQPSRRRHEVGVEHRDIGCIVEGEAGGQRAGLEATAVAAAHMMGIDAVAAQARHGVGGDVGRDVVAVVEELDRKAVARPVERAHRGHRTFHHEWLVVDRDLHQHAWQLLGQRRTSRLAARQLEQPVDEVEEIARDRELRSQAQKDEEIDQKQQHAGAAALNGSGWGLRSSGRPRCGGGARRRRRCARRGSTAPRRTWRAGPGP